MTDPDRIRLELVFEKRLDSNVMSEEKQERLLVDVRNDDYNPITISPMYVYYPQEVSDKLHPEVDPQEAYIICDGKYRYRTVKKLGLRTIKRVVKSVTEKDSLPHFYKRQRIHGHIDPFREAELFLFERVVNKRSRKEITQLYGLASENYIKTRMKLVNVAENVIKLFYEHEPTEEMPGRLTFTHLRDLSVVPRRQQKGIALLVLERNWGTREMMAEIRRVKEEMGIRASTAYVPAPKERPGVKPETRVYRRRPDPPKAVEPVKEVTEPRDRERDHEREDDREHDHEREDEGVFVLDMRIAEPILKSVLGMALYEGFDLRNKKPMDYKGDMVYPDTMLSLELEAATTSFFEKGMQSELLAIMMRAMQLYYRADQMEEEEE